MSFLTHKLGWMKPGEEPAIQAASHVLLSDHEWHRIKPGSLQLICGAEEWLSFIETTSREHRDRFGKTIGQTIGWESPCVVPVSGILGLRWAE